MTDAQGSRPAAADRAGLAEGAPEQRGPHIRVLLAEDQAMIRQALAALLSFEDDIEVVTQVGRGDEVVAAAIEHNVDVALLEDQRAIRLLDLAGGPAKLDRRVRRLANLGESTADAHVRPLDRSLRGRLVSPL